MRILVVGARFEDSFADNVVGTLEEMGHTVVGNKFIKHSRHWSTARYAMRVLEGRLAGDRPSRDAIALLATANRLRPDVVMSVTSNVHPEILEQLSFGGACRRVLWWGDAPANSRRWELLNPHWDIVYVKDPVAITKLRLVGVDARLLHEAMNPRWHRVVSLRKGEDIVIYGNYYAYRQAIALRLMREGIPLALYGPRPPSWSHPEIKRTWRGRYIMGEEKSKAIGEGLACLNTFNFSEGQSLNCRAFEIAGAGGLQLIEHRPLVDECFEPGKEVLAFRTFDELTDLIDRARRSPEEAQRIREAGARRALAEHTYRHRLERILREASS